jgi:Putative MetA-pathway of phenol degradation
VNKGFLLSVLMLGTLTVRAQNDSLRVKKKEKKELRELSPDRPHQTESPITVDPGHIMIETDLVNHTTYNKEQPHRATTGLLYFNLKVGLTKRQDIEVISNAFSFTRYEHHALPPSNTQLPDLTFRYKYNLIGNDSGSTAIAIMPFVTTTNFFQEKWKAQTGGLFLNAEHMFNEKYELGYTGGLTTFTINPFFKQHEWFSTVSFSYPIYKTFQHFVEVSERYNKSLDIRNNYSIDSGFTFTPTKNNQFDMGFYYFVPVKQFYVFLGTTIRI